MIVVLVLSHALIAIALLGAITHQGVGTWRRPAPARGFVDRFRAVPGPGYASAVAVLYVGAFGLGAWIYPTYVLDVKAALVDYGMLGSIFLFQMKEHVAVIGLALLPVYWHFWRQTPLSGYTMTRRYLTTVLMLCVWWNLGIGHLLNNIRGLT